MTARYAKNQPSGFNNAINNVAIVGATGQLGKILTEHLLKTEKHNLTALTRIGGNTTVPAGVKPAFVDYNDESSLVAALAGQDFLIITLALTAPPDTHSKIVRAAAKAGVSYIVPNAYGVDFYGKPKLREDIPGLDGIYAQVREIEQLGLNWIGITPSFWFEYSMGIGPVTYGFDFPNKSITLYDEGNTKVNTTTWPQIGRALAALVTLKKLPENENDDSVTLEQFRNKPLYISSFTLSQREMLDSVNQLMGRTDKDWNISHQSTAERYKEGLDELYKGNGMGFLKALYARAFFPTGDGIFETHNRVLGLPQEDLAEATVAAHEWAVGQTERTGN